MSLLFKSAFPVSPGCMLQPVFKPTESRFVRSVGELIASAQGPKPQGFTLR